jgi:hypothetical protein
MGDRPFLLLLAGVLLAGVVYALVIGFSIHARDVQVYTRYTAFGEAHFYKSPWQYTILFVLFGILVSAVHSALMVKLHSLERRQTALLVGWLAIVILFLASIYALSIMGLAFR